MGMFKAFDLNDALVEINPEHNGGAYAIGFRFDENGNYIVAYNKGEISKDVAVIAKDLFESMSVKYLAHLVAHKVEMAY